MQSTAVRLNDLLENLEEEDYDRAVSYIEFLIEARKKERTQKRGSMEEKKDIASIVASLTGVIPDTGKTLEEYRSERLKKYENPD